MSEVVAKGGSELERAAAVAGSAPAAAAGARAVRLARLDGWWLPLGLLAAWEVVSRAGLVPTHAMPAPSTVVGTLGDIATGGALARHVGVSVLRVLAGFAIGTAAALPVGAAVGLSRRVERVVDPTLQALRTIPSLAWVPLLLLWLGIDEAPKLTLIAIGAFFPVYLSLVAGIRNVDRKLVEVGQVYGLGALELTRRIILPGTLPHLLTGLRTGLGMAWLYLVAAELIAATRGLGYLLTDGRETSRADIVLGAIVLLAVLGKLSDGVLKAVEVRLLSWRDTYAGGEDAGS